MPDMTLPTQDWLREELAFINDTMAATLNGRLKAQLHSCDDQAQELTLRFPLQDWQVNGLGTLHGGMLSTMLDLAMSMAVYCFSRQTIPPTISMTVNYLRTVPMGAGVLAVQPRQAENFPGRQRFDFFGFYDCRPVHRHGIQRTDQLGLFGAVVHFGCTAV